MSSNSSSTCGVTELPPGLLDWYDENQEDSLDVVYNETPYTAINFRDTWFLFPVVRKFGNVPYLRGDDPVLLSDTEVRSLPRWTDAATLPEGD